MATTIKVVDGDFEKDGLKRLTTVSSTEFVRQDVKETILNSLLSELITEGGDAFTDLVEGMVTLRVTAMLEKLQGVLNETNVERGTDERIDSIDAVVVKRSKTDPRNIRFWARIITVSGTLEEFIGEV